MPFPALLLMVLFEISTLTAPLVVSVFIPPPVLSAMLTPLNVAVTLPPEAGLITTPAALFDIRLLVMTRLNAPFGSMSSAVPEKFSKTQFSRIRVPLPVTLIAVGVPPPAPVNVRFRILNTWPAANVICGSPPKPVCTPRQSIVAESSRNIEPSSIPGELRQLTWPPASVLTRASNKVGQGCAIAQGPLEVPVLDTQVNGAARNGAPCNNVVRT